MVTKPPSTKGGRVFASVVVAGVLIVGVFGPRLLDSGSDSPDTSPREGASGATSAELRAYLADNFGATSWYPLVTAVDVHGDSADITTALYDDSDAAEPARAICNAVRLSELDISYVRVTDPGGVRIVQGGGYNNQPCG